MISGELENAISMHLCHCNLDYEKQAGPPTAADTDAGHGVATSAELTQPVPPPYTTAKPVLYLPTQR